MAAQATQQQSLEAFEQQLRLKAQQGDPVACFKLVEHFERKGLAPNKLEANNRINLLMQASNQGMGAASILLAHWYLNGHYVPRDPAKAILFFEHASQVGKDSYGYFELAKIFDAGIAVQAQADKAADYLQKALAMHNPEAMFVHARQRLAQEPEHSLQVLKENYKRNKHLNSLLLINDAPEFNPKNIDSYFQANQADPSIAGLLAFRLLRRGDLAQAEGLAQQSAKANNPIGCHVRALVELEKTAPDLQLAEQYMLQAAQLGHHEAAYRAALMQFQHADQSQDDAQKQQFLHQALRLLSQAAHAGLATAQFSLGQCFLKGVAVEVNPQEGWAWVERAAQQGHVEACFNLALKLPVEHAQHLPLLKHAAQAGHAKAMLCMGIYCQNHNQLSDAIQWFEQAKAHGDARAYYFLGLAYRDGSGVEADSKQALQYLQLAGEQGDADAYFALYESYKEGLGLRKNKKSQAKYLKLAQQAGHPQALSIEE